MPVDVLAFFVGLILGSVGTAAFLINLYIEATPTDEESKPRTKSFGTITSAEGKRVVWESTVEGREESRAIKDDPRITRSRYDDLTGED